MRTGVALGSNLGDRIANLRAARSAIAGVSGVSPPILSSAVYETEAVDCEPGAGKFLNAAIEFDYNGDAMTLLDELIRIEESLGRIRDHERNVSRTVDLDLLYCGDLIKNDARLQLPHPRMRSREFVLQPLNDIRPNLVLPDAGKTVAEQLAQISGSTKVRRLTQNW